MKLRIGTLGLLCASLGACVTTSQPLDHASKTSCCSTNSLASSVGFTDKSLYQLDSNWTNDFGVSVRLETLHGHVQVVAMIFASCISACPVIVHDLQRIERELPSDVREKVRFTLITIDAGRDTPEVLHTYRRARRLPAGRWTILRGSADDTLELAALFGVKFKREASGQFAHSNLITILNEHGEIVHQVAGLNRDPREAVERIKSLLEKNAVHAAH